MKKLILSLTIMVCFLTAAQSQNKPDSLIKILAVRTSASVITPLPSRRDRVAKVVNNIRSANDYFMNRTGPDIPDTYEGKRRKVLEQVKFYWNDFVSSRKQDYENVRYTFSITDWKTQASRSGAWRYGFSLVLPEGWEYIKGTLELKGGDWKDEKYVEHYPSSIDLIIGRAGHGQVQGKASVQGKLSSDFKTQLLQNDLRLLRDILNKEHLPTDLDL